MNEAEAKTKWCPESRVGSVYAESADIQVTAINRDSRGPNPHAMCLGHGCMMFVLDREAYENAMYAFEESGGGSETGNVVSLVGGKPLPDATERPKEPDIRDFYKCGKVFPDII